MGSTKSSKSNEIVSYIEKSLLNSVRLANYTKSHNASQKTCKLHWQIDVREPSYRYRPSKIGIIEPEGVNKWNLTQKRLKAY